MKQKNFKETINWYDENAEEYSNAVFRTDPQEVLESFMNYLPPDPKVLDAGCGPGRDCELLFKNGANAIGVDLSLGLLEVAKKRYPHLQFIHANFLDLPFESNSFDGIWAHAALVHLETIDDVKKSLQEFHRVLKDKGILHLYVREKPPIPENALYDQERYFRYFTQEEIGNYVKDAKFTIKENFLRHNKKGRKGIEWICIFAQK